MTTTSAFQSADEVLPQVDILLEKVDGQVLVSQNRWVDNLLDLYNLTDFWPLRRVIEETLADMRHLRSIEGSWIRDRLLTMAAAVEVELSVDAETAFSR